MGHFLYQGQSDKPGIEYIGDYLNLRDVHPPIAGMDEWGADTLERTIRGSVPAALAATLVKGQQYLSAAFFLQSFKPFDHPIFPGYSLSYKGFINGFPADVWKNDLAQQTCTCTCSSPQQATREIVYYAPQTTYRYITNGQPLLPKYHDIKVNPYASGFGQGLDAEPYIFSSVITIQGQGVQSGSVDLATLDALTPIVIPQMGDMTSTTIIGTPYWEVSEPWQRIFQQG